MNSDKPVVPGLSHVALNNKTQREIKDRAIRQTEVFHGRAIKEVASGTSATGFIVNFVLQSAGFNSQVFFISVSV